MSAPGPRPPAASPRRRSWLIAAGVAWIAAPVLGLVLLALGTLALGLVQTGARPSAAATALGWVYGAGFALVWTPMFSWIGMVLAMPLAMRLVRGGRVGLAGFALLGLAVGALCGAGIAAAAGGTAVGVWAGFGALAGLVGALVFRSALFRLEPEIFTTR